MTVGAAPFDSTTRSQHSSFQPEVEVSLTSVAIYSLVSMFLCAIYNLVAIHINDVRCYTSIQTAFYH